MTNLTFNSYYYKQGNDFEKRCTITFNSTELGNIPIFDHKHYYTNDFNAGGHISLNGESNKAIIHGGTWAQVQTVIDGLLSEINTKWNNLKTSLNFNDILNIPDQELT